jgi:type II secretory pathway pseudopilin PulG
MALAGLVLGYFGVALVTVIIIFIITASLAPYWFRPNTQANEIAAVASLRQISTAAKIYSSRHGAFPQSLSAVGPSGAGLIDADLASGQRQGYAFAYVERGQYRGQATDAFEASADPVVENQTGAIHYFVDETGVVRWRKGNAAGRDSPPLP